MKKELKKRRIKTVNKTAIITGVTGQDGSYLSELLLSKGYEVVGWIRRSSTNHINERLKDVEYNEHFHLVEADLSDYGSVSGAYNTSRQILEGAPSEFYNLAAQSHVGTSFTQKDFTTMVDLCGVYHCLDCIVDKGDIDKTRFLQASTSELMGSNYDMIEYKGQTLKAQNENTNLMPNSPYAIAKLGAHHAVRMYRAGYGLHASCSICYNHESPRRGENFVTRKITKYVAELGKFLNVRYNPYFPCLIYDDDYIMIDSVRYPKLRLGNISACRDWSHAKDMVYGMYLMLQQDKPDDYVLSSGETHSVEDFAKLCFRYIGYYYQDFTYIDKEFYRPVDVEYLLGIPEKAEKILGWTRTYSFNDLVIDMMEAELGK